MTLWKPSAAASVVHKDAELTIYSDATWEPTAGHISGWTVHHDAVVYSAGAGDARITTKAGRSKVSKVTSPDGKFYDIRAIAAGTVKGPS